MNDEEIMTGKVCPYCGQPSVYVDSSEVYGRSYGMIYLCRPCRAWVGVHKGTDVALGRLANRELREAKKKAHEHFDILWNKITAEMHEQARREARAAAYAWLSGQMQLPPERTHIGMFDIEQCKFAINLCKVYREE